MIRTQTIRAQSNIADLIDRMRAKAGKLAAAKISSSLPRGRDGHPWRSADTLWPTFGQD